MNPNTKTQYSILITIGICHLLNDSLQAVIPAMFPILEESLGLTFTQLGLIAFSLNMVASVMQPVIGLYTDKRPIPYALPIGLSSSMLGMLGLALAPNYPIILISVIFIGLGSATFHPEGSRVAFLAAGDKRGLAQSIFQVGGNAGQSLAPLITAVVLVPLGQIGALWFTLIAFIAVIILSYIAKWYKKVLVHMQSSTNKTIELKRIVSNKVVYQAITILVLFVFIRTWYHSAIANFYIFYAMETFDVSISAGQVFIFVFLFTGAIGTFFGGPLGDRFGKRNVLIFSLLLPAPFALLLPYANLISSYVLLTIIGFTLMTSFSVAVVYAQELMPGKVGMVSGLIVGLAFGMGAIGAVVFGSIIDWIGITKTMNIIAFIPLLGFIAFVLPSDKKVRTWYQ